ncbi:carbohydrate-binding domain-containing protein [Candidatus Saccharibacteria bacterium]|nr:carbohydrate-binding domain-containing protein [Candidatus Saccharibacteria bacterium]
MDNMGDDHTRETQDLEFRPEEDFGENPDEFVPPAMPEYEMTDDGLPEGEAAEPTVQQAPEKVEEEVKEPEPQEYPRVEEIKEEPVEEVEPVKEVEEPVEPVKEAPRQEEYSDSGRAKQLIAADRATHMDEKTKRTGLKLLWVTILAIVLLAAAGFGVWRLTESLDKNQPKPASSDHTPQTEEVTVNIDDALEVNLEYIDLAKYSTNIVITEPGDYTLTGDFKHTVFVNSKADAITLVLDNVNIESEVAIVNAKERTAVEIQSAEGSKNSLASAKLAKNYPAVIWSQGTLNFTGEGHTEIIAPEVDKDANVTAETAPAAVASESSITFKDGYYFLEGHIRAKDYFVNGGVLVAVAYKNIATPDRESTQGYVPKNFLNVYSGKLTTTMNSEEGGKLVTFTTDRTFSSLLVSKSDVVNEREYAFSFSENSEAERGIAYPVL